MGVAGRSGLNWWTPASIVNFTAPVLRRRSIFVGIGNFWVNDWWSGVGPTSASQLTATGAAMGWA